jgi:hypothetical protein
MYCKENALRTIVRTFLPKTVVILLLAGFSFSLPAGGRDLPSFQELYQVLRSNLPGVTEQDLDRAAVQGLLAQFPSKVLLVSSQEAKADTKETPPLAKANTYDNAFAYLRVGLVAPGLPEQLLASFQALQRTNGLKGIVLDLRFAGGTDYAAAAAVANHFLAAERPLLDWGEGMVHSTPKSNAILLPIAVLVNQETTGAAEALAAILRETQVALIIGSKTAGAANIYTEHTLNGGQRVRVAASSVTLGSGKALSSEGVKPDIQVRTTLESERAYLEDAYVILPRPGENPAVAGAETNHTSAAGNRTPRRRINEAELVRMQREGLSPDFDPTTSAEPAPLPPQINDPALNRALDLLKGLAVVQQVRRG